ncbi:MAG TPA: hypothetical protein VGL89_08235 [Candidatus Koribacter sp.]
MKKALLLVSVAVSTFTFGQGQVLAPQPTSPTVLPTNIVQKGVAATYSDVYCAGWMSPQDMKNDSYVLAGEESPNTSRFIKNDSIFLSGAGWQEGQKISLVRRAKDPNYYTMYQGQTAEVKKAGNLFFDMGQATVTFVQSNVAVAHIDFACDGVVPGDLAVPFQERPLAAFHPRPFDFKHFVPVKGAPTGRIILSRDFDVYLGEGKKFYVNIGSSQGLKSGDYIRILRGYDVDDYDPADFASLHTLSYDDDQWKEPGVDRKRFKEVPKRSVGEAVILTTTATTATAMITYTVEDVHIGDHFEVEPPEGGGQ